MRFCFSYNCIFNVLFQVLLFLVCYLLWFTSVHFRHLKLQMHWKLQRTLLMCSLSASNSSFMLFVHGQGSICSCSVFSWINRYLTSLLWCIIFSTLKITQSFIWILFQCLKFLIHPFYCMYCCSSFKVSLVAQKSRISYIFLLHWKSSWTSLRCPFSDFTSSSIHHTFSPGNTYCHSSFIDLIVSPEI